MIIEPFTGKHIDHFIKLALQEKWLVDQWELEFLIAAFPQGCLVAHDGSGHPEGFVTAIKHDHSGWIGNLIVDSSCRGNGIGGMLFRSAVTALQTAGVETIWLTASKSGMPLYEKYGFRSIDTIVRWHGNGRRFLKLNEPDQPDNCFEALCRMDSDSWGDNRLQLLAVTSARGRLFGNKTAIAALQPCGDNYQLGPFVAANSSSAGQLLQTAFRAISSANGFFVDSPAGNRAAIRLFKRKGLQQCGENELMYAGVKPAYKPELIYGLATMGSSG